MLKIILCDDDQFILCLGQDKINAIIDACHLDAKIVSKALDSKELLFYIKNNSDRYLIFLDLDFGNGKLNGIDIAKALRQTSSDCKIVFTTNHQEMAMEVLKSGVEPFGFLEKTSDIGKLANGYQKYIQMALPKSDTTQESLVSAICLSVGIDESVLISLDDIVFVETEKNVSHGITYHTLNGSTLTIISTLDAEQERLGESFIRVHRSIVVNKDHILGMTDGYLKLSTQQEVPCSFRLRSEVKKWVR